MEKKIELLTAFKQNVLELMNEILSYENSDNKRLRNYFSTSDNDIQYLRGKINAFKIIVKSSPTKVLIKRFILETKIKESGSRYDIKTLILKRKEEYFLTSKHLFGVVNDDRAKEIIMYLVTKLMNDEDKEVMWQYLHAFIQITDEYLLLEST